MAETKPDRAMSETAKCFECGSYNPKVKLSRHAYYTDRRIPGWQNVSDECDSSFHAPSVPPSTPAAPLTGGKAMRKLRDLGVLRPADPDGFEDDEIDDEEAAASQGERSAREWRIALGWVGKKRAPFLTHDGRDGICLDDESAEYIRQLQSGQSQQAGRIATWCEVLKKACDRDWKDESPDQIVMIAANAIYWRQRRGDTAEAKLALLNNFYASDEAETPDERLMRATDRMIAAEGQLREQAVELEAVRAEAEKVTALYYKENAYAGEQFRRAEALEVRLGQMEQALRHAVGWEREYRTLNNLSGTPFWVALAEAALPPEEAK